MAAKLKTEISAARGGERPAPYSTTCRAGRGQIVHHLGIQRKENHVGLLHPPRLGRHGRSSLHRLDRSICDRPAPHQP
ncbi:unnamed protein product, partial [Coregonus sp. 'balchen']